MLHVHERMSVYGNLVCFELDGQELMAEAVARSAKAIVSFIIVMWCLLHGCSGQSDDGERPNRGLAEEGFSKQRPVFVRLASIC